MTTFFSPSSFFVLVGSGKRNPRSGMKRTLGSGIPVHVPAPQNWSDPDSIESVVHPVWIPIQEEKIRPTKIEEKNYKVLLLQS